MRFIVDEDLPRSTCALLRKYGHVALDVRDIGFRGAKDSEIASYAQREGLCIYAGLVILKLPRMATASTILQLLESLLRQEALVAEVPGKLAIVEFGRVRIRTA